MDLYRFTDAVLKHSRRACFIAVRRLPGEGGIGVLLVNLPLPFATWDLEAVKMSMHVSTEWCRLDHALCSKLILTASHLQT